MQDKEVKTNHSIRFRLIVTLAGLIVFTIFLCWFMNRTLLSKYYEYLKINTLGNVYTEVNHIYNLEETSGSEDGDAGLEEESSEDMLTAEDEISLMLERIGSNRNISVYIVSLYQVGRMIVPKWHYPFDISNLQGEQIATRIFENYFNAGVYSDEMEILKSEASYDICKVFDKRMESNYIELYGALDNGLTVYIRSNLESIQESVSIANSFLAYIGCIAILVGIVIMYFISRSFTKPVLQLSDIAKKMSNLDFNVKYKVDREDEIGVLGTSINALSEKLEQTISELKSANNELKSDIENKIQIDEMRKEFLSNVSHELKTPIALIQGYAEGLKENINDDDESRDFYCEVIIDEAVKMNKMVKKLLSLNQIESGNNQVNIERFDIISLIQSLLSSTEILFQQKNCSLYLDNYPPIYVWADEYMVEEVFTNYISNALNHVEEGGSIKVALYQKETVVRITVFNTGNPIPEEDLDNIWIKFYKVDKARTREYGGSGIGLSIVKAIMVSLNQECGVVNYKNGVEFWFELDTKA